MQLRYGKCGADGEGRNGRDNVEESNPKLFRRPHMMEKAREEVEYAEDKKLFNHRVTFSCILFACSSCFTVFCRSVISTSCDATSRCLKPTKNVKVCFYIVQYPIRRTAQAALHFIPAPT